MKFEFKEKKFLTFSTFTAERNSNFPITVCNKGDIVKDRKTTK